MEPQRRASLPGRVIQKLSSMINVTKCNSKQAEMVDRDLPERDARSPDNLSEGDEQDLEGTPVDWVKGSPAEPPLDQKKLHKKGKGPLEKRRSSPGMQVVKVDSKMRIGPRSSSQPVLVAFLPQYVNKLKAQNFTLKEKMTQWCKKSPNALIRKHLPPEDFYVPFPNEPYEDKMCDEYGRSYERLARAAEDAAAGTTPKPRVEIVLERYPAGLHGIECSFDRAPNNGDRVVSPYGVSGGAPGKAKRVSYDVVIPARPQVPLEGQRSRMSMNRPSGEGGKPVPPPVNRLPSDTSLLPMGMGMGMRGPGRVLSQDSLDLSGLQMLQTPVPEGEVLEVCY